MYVCVHFVPASLLRFPFAAMASWVKFDCFAYKSRKHYCHSRHSHLKQQCTTEAKENCRVFFQPFISSRPYHKTTPLGPAFSMESQSSPNKPPRHQWNADLAVFDSAAFQVAPHDKAPWVLCKERDQNREHAMHLPWLDRLGPQISSQPKFT